MADKLPVCEVCGRHIPRCFLSDSVVECVCGKKYSSKTPSKTPPDESKDRSRPPTRGKGKTANLDEAGAIGTGHGDTAKGGRD